ncbi:MAG: hypothetical protein HFJ72_08380 [Adlercreutzia sp.]|nr:hypothetical protein [Adlercreutzia sp.]
MASNSFTKDASVKGLSADEAELAAVNRCAIEPLAAEDVFLFEVSACSNDVDRDHERIDDASLDAMAQMFVGKTVVTDHRHTTKEQIARVYAAATESTGEKTADGRDKKVLALRCYMLDVEENAAVIRDIKAGIKREVSVCFAASTATCSICGNNKRRKWCEHRPGRDYDGARCHVVLGGVHDCYELSFVAVPAQRDAGVRKDYLAADPEDAGGGEPPDAAEKSEDVGNEEPEGSFFMAKALRLAEDYLTLKEATE